MSYSLWYGGREVGQVVAQLPTSDPRMFAGLLRLEDNGGPIQTSMQFRMPEVVPGRPVFRHDPSANPKGGTYELRALSKVEAQGLSKDEQFFLRDPAGQLVETDMVALERRAVPEARGEFPDFCRAHGFDGTAWVLVVHGPPPGGGWSRGPT